VFGQTIELFGVMAAGGAIGLAESPGTAPCYYNTLPLLVHAEVTFGQVFSSMVVCQSWRTMFACWPLLSYVESAIHSVYFSF
jgi:hypothetical protein